MIIYVILGPDYGSYTIDKMFICKEKAEDYLKKELLKEKIEYEKDGYGVYEDKGYDSIYLEVFKTED